ncbi:MAG: ABC-2 family transporter protein [Candidatus Eisenbacteria bacterium]
MLTIYWVLATASIREQMSYRASFLLEMTGKLIVTGVELAALFFLFDRVEAIGGWTQWEVIYLYAIASVSLGFAEMLTTGLDAMPELVRTGAMDGLLIRPVPPLLQLLGRDIRLLQLGRTLQGAVALTLALTQLPATRSEEALLFLVLAIVCTTAIYVGVFIAAGASCFWTVQSGEVFNAFTYGGAAMTQFPISVYPGWLRALFLFLIPLGMTTYLPAARAVGKEPHWGAWFSWLPRTGASDAGSLAWLPWTAPLVAAVFLFLCWRFWRLGLDHYQGTGS